MLMVCFLMVTSRKRESNEAQLLHCCVVSHFNMTVPWNEEGTRGAERTSGMKHWNSRTRKEALSRQMPGANILYSHLLNSASHQISCILLSWSQFWSLPISSASFGSQSFRSVDFLSSVAIKTLEYNRALLENPPGSPNGFHMTTWSYQCKQMQWL